MGKIYKSNTNKNKTKVLTLVLSKNKLSEKSNTEDRYPKVKVKGEKYFKEIHLI